MLVWYIPGGLLFVCSCYFGVKLLLLKRRRDSLAPVPHNDR